jgi:hypothetical protein
MNNKLKEKSLRQATYKILSHELTTPRDSATPIITRTPVEALITYEQPNENVSTASES